MQPSTTDWQYNSRSKVLKIKVEQVVHGIKAIHSVTHPSKYEDPVTFEHRFEPEEIVHDENGLIRSFTYLTKQGDRFEFLSQETTIDSPAKAWGDIAVKIVDLVILGYQIHTHYKKYTDTYQKVVQKQFTAQQAVAHLGFWEMKIIYNRHVMGSIMNSAPVQKASNIIHKNLVKLFPQIRPNSRVTYYERGGKYKVEGALYNFMSL